MKRVVVTKKVKFDSDDHWINHTKGSNWLVHIDHINHMIKFQNLGGNSPNLISFLNFIMNDKDMREEIEWANAHYKRKNPYFVREFYDNEIEYMDFTVVVIRKTKEGNMLQQEAAHIHISSYGKLNYGIPNLFAGDLILLFEKLLHSKREFFTMREKLINKRIYFCYPKRVSSSIPFDKIVYPE